MVFRVVSALFATVLLAGPAYAFPGAPFTAARDVEIQAPRQVEIQAPREVEIQAPRGN